MIPLVVEKDGPSLHRPCCIFMELKSWNIEYSGNHQLQRRQERYVLVLDAHQSLMNLAVHFAILRPEAYSKLDPRLQISFWSIFSFSPNLLIDGRDAVHDALLGGQQRRPALRVRIDGHQRRQLVEAVHDVLVGDAAVQVGHVLRRVEHLVHL